MADKCLLEDLLRLPENALAADGGSDQLGVLAEELLLLRRRRSRHEDSGPHHQVSAAPPPEAADSPAAQADLGAGGRSGRDRDLLGLLEGRDLDFASENEGRERQVET